MSALELFSFKNATVRVVMVDGEPWWVAKDVCEILGLTNSREALTRVNAARVSTTDAANSAGAMRQAPIVNESGLYDLIFDSRKPEARAFREWITGEVIPSIRKTGSYGTPVLPQSYSDALRELASTVDSLSSANERIALDAPKVEGYDDLIEADGFFTMEAVAKSLSAATGGLGRNKLLADLRIKGVIMQGATLPYQQHVDAGYLSVRVDVNDKGAYPYTVATVKGLEWLRKKYRNT